MTTDIGSVLAPKRKLPPPGCSVWEMHRVFADSFAPKDWHWPAIPLLPEPERREHPCPCCDRPARWFLLGNERKKLESWQAYCDWCSETARARWVTRRLVDLGVPAGYADRMTFEQYIPDSIKAERILREAQRMTESGSTRWLALLGQTGIGKTHLAVSILRAVLEQHVRSVDWEWWSPTKYCPLRLPHQPISEPKLMFVRGSEVFADLQVGYRANRMEIRNALVAPQVLIVDDFDADFSKAEAKIFESVLDARYSTPRTTMITSNLSHSDFFQALGSRTLSRFSELGVPITVEPTEIPDHRRLKKL